MKDSKGFILPVIFLIILVISGGAYFLYLNSRNPKASTIDKQNQANQTSITKHQTNNEFEFKIDSLKISDFKSYPVHVTNLILVPIDQQSNQSIKVPIKLLGEGGTVGYGDLGPVASPDLRSTAAIVGTTLYLVSADGNNTVQTPKNLVVSYISGWSPDSKKIIIYSSKEEFGQGGDGPIFTPTPTPTFEIWPSGFYLIDITTGNSELLSNITTFVSWINNSEILMQESQLKGDYSVFNLDNNSVDTHKIPTSFKDYFNTQLSFDSQGKNWAFSVGNSELSGKKSYSNIVLAQFPSFTGKTIVEAGWAEVQFPVISPDGNEVIYQQGPNIENIYYSDADASARFLVNGRIRQWIDNERFIYRLRRQSESEKFEYYIYSLKTSQSTKIY